MAGGLITLLSDGCWKGGFLWERLGGEAVSVSYLVDEGLEFPSPECVAAAAAKETPPPPLWVDLQKRIDRNASLAAQARLLPTTPSTTANGTAAAGARPASPSPAPAPAAVSEPRCAILRPPLPSPFDSAQRQCSCCTVQTAPEPDYGPRWAERNRQRLAPDSFDLVVVCGGGLHASCTSFVSQSPLRV